MLDLGSHEIHPSTFQTYEARPLCFCYTKCQLQGCWCTSSGVVNISLSFSTSKSGHMQAASRRPSASFIHLVSYRFFDAALHTIKLWDTCWLDRFPVKTRLMSDDMDSTCWSTYCCVCLPTWPSAQHAHPRKATSMNRGEEEMLQPMATNASFRSIASWLSDNIASVSRNSFLCHASVWLQVKQRALWFAQLLSKPVRLDPCVLLYKVPVERLLKHSRHSFRLFESVLHALQSLCMPAHMTFAQHAHPRKATSINRGEEMLQPMATNASFRSIASWLSDNIASVSRNSFLCHASFWLQVKQRALWFAQLLSKPVRLDPCVLLYKVPVTWLLKHSRHRFQCFQCFQVKLAGTNFQASIYLLSCVFLKASCTLSSLCVCLPTWPSAQHAHPRKATSINRGEEEMLQPMATNASFRSIASWLSDNIASVSRNSFLCHASFWLQVKQRALWFAQLLSKPVTLDPCVLLCKVPVTIHGCWSTHGMIFRNVSCFDLNEDTFLGAWNSVSFQGLNLLNLVKQYFCQR